MSEEYLSCYIYLLIFQLVMQLVLYCQSKDAKQLSVYEQDYIRKTL